MAVESIEITRRGTPPVSSGGCSCCGPAAPSQAATPSTGAQVTAYGVDGMTCGHCAGVVTAAIQGLPGVADVVVDLTPGGVSTVTVTSAGPVSAEDVDAVVREAGYRLA